MAAEVEVDIIESAELNGKVTLRTPTAGQRNAALMKAERPEGINNTVFMFELVPLCIAKHPWLMKPVREAVDALDFHDYDRMVIGLGNLLRGDEELKKK